MAGQRNLGEQMRLLRKANGLTQTQVAEILNIHRTTYTAYETNKNTPDILLLPRFSASAWILCCTSTSKKWTFCVTMWKNMIPGEVKRCFRRLPPMSKSWWGNSACFPKMTAQSC